MVKAKELEVLVEAVRMLEKTAIAHSEWADRFLTFGREYSLVCERISEEMVTARNLLKMLLTRRFESGVESLAARDDDYHPNVQTAHFFVIGRDMAQKIVANAVQMITESARSFRRGLEMSSDPELSDLFIKLLKVSEEILCRWEEILTDWEVAATFEERSQFYSDKVS